MTQPPKPSAWSRLLFPLMRKFRLKRAELIRSQFPDIENMRVLDLGGSTHFWDAVCDIIEPNELTILNIVHDGTSVSAQHNEGRFKVELYDGDQIPAEDEAFDLVICNSVIEHVPLDKRTDLASEIQRVGKHYVVQTPAYEFFLEPHFLAPFIHWLPRIVGRAVAGATPFAIMHRQTSMKKMFNQIQLLRKNEFIKLFPTGTVHVERFGGMPKSYLIIG